MNPFHDDDQRAAEFRKIERGILIAFAVLGVIMAVALVVVLTLPLPAMGVVQ